MSCIKCGAVTETGWDGKAMDHCRDCYKPDDIAAEVKTKKQSHKYAVGIWLHRAIAVLIAIIAVVFFAVDNITDSIDLNIPKYQVGLVFLVFFALHILTAIGLKKHNMIAVLYSLLVGFLLLFAFPIGTVIGGLLIFSIVKTWYL